MVFLPGDRGGPRRLDHRSSRAVSELRSRRSGIGTMERKMTMGPRRFRMKNGLGVVTGSFLVLGLAVGCEAADPGGPAIHVQVEDSAGVDRVTVEGWRSTYPLTERRWTSGVLEGWRGAAGSSPSGRLVARILQRTWPTPSRPLHLIEVRTIGGIPPWRPWGSSPA